MSLPPRHFLFLFATGAVVSLAVWVLVQGYGTSGPFPGAPVTRALERSVEGRSPYDPGSPSSSQAPLTPQEFAALREKLVALEAGWDGSPPVPRELLALVNEVVSRAPFSPGMLEILDLDDSDELVFTASVLRDVVEDRLTRSGSTALRQRLVEVIQNDDSDYFPAKEWHLSAGKGCTTEEYARLSETVADPKLRRELAEGHALGLVSVDASRAVEVALDHDRKEQANTGRLYPDLTTRVFEHLPPATDFALLESLLPRGIEPNSGDRMRVLLATRWSHVDPAGASAWILSHQDDVPPGALGGIAGGFDQNEPGPALEWTATFPPGKYYDTAAFYVVMKYSRGILNETGALREMVSKIQDPGQREQAQALLSGGFPLPADN